MTTTLKGNDHTAFRLYAGNTVVAFAATRSQLYLIAAQRGWTIR
jgi:hypothetical protein